jgi:hypothetical protein
VEVVDVKMDWLSESVVWHMHHVPEQRFGFIGECRIKYLPY